MGGLTTMTAARRFYWEEVGMICCDGGGGGDETFALVLLMFSIGGPSQAALRYAEAFLAGWSVLGSSIPSPASQPRD